MQPGYGAAPGGYPNYNYGGGEQQGYPPGVPSAPPGHGAPPAYGAPGGQPMGPGFNIGQGTGMMGGMFARQQASDGPGGEDGLGDGMNAFSVKSVRLGFIRKVYSILSVQLIITFGFVLIFSLNKSSKVWAAQNQGLLFLAFGVSIGSLLTLACCGSVRRKFPLNFICLGFFTLAQSFLLGFIAAFYNTQSVLLAVAMTAAVCIGLTIFAMQTKIDFTPLNGIMFVCVIILMVMGMVLMFFKIAWLQTLYAGLGAVIFSVYLVIDTQMIVGGSHKKQMSPEEYIFGAITLYTDIINIFLFLLQLFGSRD